MMAKTKLTRRYFLQMTGGALGLATLAACAPTVAPTGAGGEATPMAEMMVSQDNPLWVLHTEDYHPDYNAFIRKHIEDYAAEQGWPLEVAYTAGFLAGGADIQKISAAVASDEAPDVWMHSVSVSQMKALGNVVNVTDIVEEIVAQYGEIAPLMRKNTYIEDGFYGIPFHGRAGGGYARDDIFKEHGIDIATIRQYGDLREACLEVSDPGKELWGWGITINRSGDGNTMIYRAIHGWGATWTDETGQYVTIDSPETVDAINWLVDTFTNPAWEPMLPPGILSWTDTSNNEAYLASKIVYTQNAGTVLAKAYFDKNPVAEVTAFHPMCGGPKLPEFNGQGGQNFLMITGGKNPEAARQLIMSFFTEESMQAVYENARTYAIPAYESMWDWPIIKDTPQSIAVKPSALDPSGYNGLAWPGPPTPQIAAVDTAAIGADMVASVITGDATPEEAVKTAYERAVQIFKEFGAPATR
jgi:multiple sugar transport system substrate-binding protein